MRNEGKEMCQRQKAIVSPGILLQRLWTAWMPRGNRSCPKLGSAPGCSEANQSNARKLI